QEDIIFLARWTVRRAKDVSKAETFERLVIFRIARSGERAAQAAGKEEEPGILERQVDGGITAGGDAGDGAGVAAVDAEALLRVTDYVFKKVVFPFLFGIGGRVHVPRVLALDGDGDELVALKITREIGVRLKAAIV